MGESILAAWKLQGWALLAGCVLDWIFGDPHDFPHPVRMMGAMIGKLEYVLRKAMGNRPGAAGLCLVVIMCLFWTAVPALALGLIALAAGGLPYGFYTWPLFFAEAFISYQLLAARSLQAESMKVCQALEAGDTEQARQAVSMIVGRDTAILDRAGITRAAVETVAENASDGVIAPFLFMAFLGPAGGCFYKAVNTMDSMVGYKNEDYLLFGRAAARLDDLVNLVPSRLTGCLITAAAWLLPDCDGRNAWRIFRRDRRNHASPNSAHGEAACAGALHLRLAGDAWYFGTLHKKPFIGDDDRPIEAADIRRAGHLMLVSEGILMAVLLMLLLW